MFLLGGVNRHKCGGLTTFAEGPPAAFPFYVMASSSLVFSDHFFHAPLNHADVQAQGVNVVGVGERYRGLENHLVHGLELVEHAAGLFPVCQFVGLGIKPFELFVPLEDAPPDLPAVGGRGDLEQRKEQGQQRDEQDLESFHGDGDLEGQVAHQERRAVLVEAFGLVAQGEKSGLAVGELAGQGEHVALAVRLGGGEQEQVFDGRVQVSLDHQVGGGSEQGDLVGGQVLDQVKAAGRQGELGQVVMGADIGLGSVKGIDSDFFGFGGQLAHGVGVDARNGEQGVDFAVQELVGRVARAFGQQTGGVVGDAVFRQQGPDQVGGAAAVGPDRDLATFELV